MAIYLLCGLAFAGKSTLARAISARTGGAIVSLDAINEERGLRGGLGIPGAAWAEAHQTAMQRAEAILARGASVVVDDTSCFRFLRDDYRALAGRFGARCLLVYLDTPVETVLSRLRANDATLARPRVTEEVLMDLAQRFERPGPDEPHLVFTPGTDLAAWLRSSLPEEGSHRVG